MNEVELDSTKLIIQALQEANERLKALEKRITLLELKEAGKMMDLDGEYSISTLEKQQEFAKRRNYNIEGDCV